MKHSKFTSPFPPLVFSSLDSGRLDELAQMFVKQHVALYQQYLTTDHETVDQGIWKFSTKKDDLRVFVERKDATAPSDMFFPALLAVGTIPGDLDDVMHGTLNPTMDLMRLQSAFLEDQMVDCAVLATVIEPSMAYPFRALTVKWIEHSHTSLMVRSVVKNRDYVYMEATGTEYMVNGDRYGYHLMHSTHFPQTPHLDGNLRGNMSVCMLFRQKSNNLVDVFIKCILSPEDDMMRSIRIKAATVNLLAATKYAAFGQQKKLAWFVQRRPSTQKSPVVTSEMCCSCEKRVSTSVLGGIRNSSCRVCSGSICSSCKVKRKISSVAPDRQLWNHEIVFCSSCLHEATTSNAQEIAKEQIGMTGIQGL